MHVPPPAHGQRDAIRDPGPGQGPPAHALGADGLRGAVHSLAQVPHHHAYCPVSVPPNVTLGSRLQLSCGRVHPNARRETSRIECVVLKLDIWRSNLVKAFPTSTHRLLFVHPYSQGFCFIQGLSIFRRCSSCWLHSCFSCPY